MKKIAFLFPGQGAQAVGMGRDFIENSQVARELFEEANDLLHEDISKIIFEGPEDILKQTKYSQVAIYLTSLAILKTLQVNFPHLQPAMSAGLSLGEYSALTAAGWIDFSEALPLVYYRGQLMHAACEKSPGTMAALFGLPALEVRRMVEELRLPNDLWVANYNSSEQTVISGTLKGVERGIEEAKARGAKRAIPLKVHGAFHSGLMREAEELLLDRISRLSFRDKGSLVVMNACGKPVSTKEEIHNHLQRQITSSVLWEGSIRSMEGCELFLEIGPGKVLAGLNKQIGVVAPTFSINKFEEMDSLATII